MITTHKITCKSFKHTATQRFGGWVCYFQLYKKALVQLKEVKETLKLTNHQIAKAKFVLFMQCLFKPFKQFYRTVSIQEGTAEAMWDNDEIIGIRRIRVCKTQTKHYLFGIFFLTSLRGMTDKEVMEVIK